MAPLQERFAEIIQLIKNGRDNAIRCVNTELIDLNWNIGRYISEKVERSEWGQAVVKELSLHIQKTEPELKGYSDKNLWRMKQFYEAYRDEPKLSALLREISWTNNIIIMSRAKTLEEKEFYLKLCCREKYSTRELERQITSGVFERTLLGSTKLSAPLREMHPDINGTFKDSYILYSLNLKEPYTELMPMYHSRIIIRIPQTTSKAQIPKYYTNRFSFLKMPAEPVLTTAHTIKMYFYIIHPLDALANILQFLFFQIINAMKPGGYGILVDSNSAPGSIVKIIV